VKGLTLGPKLPEAYLSAAQIDLWSKWDFKPAIEKLLDGVRQFPAFIELQNTLVAAYKIVGQYDKAETHSDICIALDPNNHFHYYNRGRICFLKRDYGKAVTNIQRSISMQPNFKMGMFDLFEIYLVTGDREAFDSFTEEYASFEHVPMMKYIFSLKNSSETNFEDDSEAGASGVDGERLLLSTYKVLFQGNHSLAINLIEQGIRAHLSQFIFIKDNPILDSLKEYDAFNEMMSRVFEIEVNEQKKSSSQEPSPKVKQVLSEEQVDHYTKKLEQVYDEGECYLNPSLSLKDVSLEMVIHPNKLSWLINERFKMNFNEFTNHYRLKAF
jgi:adenylate cyclase